MTQNLERHRLDFPEMDAQHDYCYHLFDMIHPVADSGDAERFKALLHEIEMYLMFHFESEERLMKIYQAPGFAVHQTDHENAAHRLISFLDEFDNGTLDPARLRIFLTGWLMEHSAGSDREYVAWIRQYRESTFGIP